MYKKLTKKIIFATATWLNIIGLGDFAQSAETSPPYIINIFDYKNLSISGSALIDQFHERGYIAIRGVPGFSETYHRFLKTAEQFIALPQKEKTKYMPEDNYARGWSLGIETFNGLRDSYKGSYYAHFPDEEKFNNIWPELVNFKENYLAVSEIIFKTGLEVLSLIGLNMEFTGLGRMLYYSSVFESSNDGSPYWCGNHRDHGVFTGLCPELYKKDGLTVEKPKGSGLYILEQEISPPDDVMMFQMGEVTEILTNGKVKATDHYVKKAYGGFERYAFALFFDPKDQTQILKSDNPEVLKKYEDRYSEGITFQDWNARSYARYNLGK